MRRWGLLLALPLVVAAKGASVDPEALARRADAAYRGGEVARAAELYDRAGERTTEPSRAAYNLAAARYRQAREKGHLAALGEAEISYRACLRPGDPYRARALYGLGNCLLLRATSASALDRAALRSAIDRFGECARDRDCDSELRAAARYNRAKARLLLLQAPRAESGGEEPPGDESNKDDDQQPQSKPKDGGKGEPGDGDKKLTPGGAADKVGEQPAEKKEGEPGPGQGVKLTPPPEDREAPPPAKEDAARHVEMAARRIVEDLAAHKRGKARPAGPGVRDW